MLRLLGLILLVGLGGALIGLIFSFIFPGIIAVPLSFIGGMAWGYFAAQVSIEKGWV
jgi:hypothetical protein